MKKYLYLAIFASLIISILSFTIIKPSKKKAAKSKVTSIKKLTPCSCATPTNFFGNASGSTTTFTWTAVTGAIAYSFGGNYSSGGGFTYCVTGTSITISTSSGGTVQVRAICEGTCSNATCSSSPTGPLTF